MDVCRYLRKAPAGSGREASVDSGDLEPALQPPCWYRALSCIRRRMGRPLEMVRRDLGTCHLDRTASPGHYTCPLGWTFPALPCQAPPEHGCACSPYPNHPDLLGLPGVDKEGTWVRGVGSDLTHS